MASIYLYTRGMESPFVLIIDEKSNINFIGRPLPICKQNILVGDVIIVNNVFFPIQDILGINYSRNIFLLFPGKENKAVLRIDFKNFSLSFNLSMKVRCCLLL